MTLSVREATAGDIKLIGDYWFNSSHQHLVGMGVDTSKMMARADLEEMLKNQLALPLEKRNSNCFIWEINKNPVGHCNCNPTTFGREAKMHLHLWESESRKKGVGLELLKMTIPKFFNDLQIQQLICEPYALNQAPNRTVEKAGFEFDCEYITTPGGHSFEQSVKRWVMTFDRFKEIYGEV